MSSGSSGGGSDGRWVDLSPELWDRLRAAFRTSDALHAWLTRSNPSLAGRTPAEALQAGDAAQVLAALRALGSDSP